MPLTALVVIISTFSCLAQETVLPGRVIDVYDGNTITVSTPNDGDLRIVFLGIDCPELGQGFGEAAKEFLTKEILNHQVQVALHGKDRYRNYIGVVMKDSMDLRIALLDHGLAWTAESNSDPILDSHLAAAQSEGIGLWSDNSAIAPWIWRRQQSMLLPKFR